MNGVLIGAAAAGVLAGVTYFNYRRMVPKPIGLGDTEYPISCEPLPVEANGHTLYGELLVPQGLKGKLPTVICCHGFGSSYKQCKNSIGLSLAKSGFAVYCFDFFGGSEHSRSGGSMLDMSIFTERDDLETVICAIKKLDTTDEENLFLLGQSQGGCVAAMTAPALAGDIRAMILYYPALCIPDDARKRFKQAVDIPPVVKNFGHKVGKRYYEGLLDYDVYAALSDYTGPVLILHGDRDKMVPVSYSERAAKCYANAEFVLLPGEIHGFTAAGKRIAAKRTYDFLTRSLYGADAVNKGE